MIRIEMPFDFPFNGGLNCCGNLLRKSRGHDTLVSQASLFFYEGARAEGGGKKSLVT